MIRLRQPIDATALLGRKKRIGALALLPDDLDGFRAAVESAV